MPKADCCGKDIKECNCADRSRSAERRKRETKETRDNTAAEKEKPPAWALSMQQNLLQGLRGVVKDELKPVQEDLEKVKKSVAAVEGRVAQVEAEVKKNSIDEQWAQRIKDMEAKLSTINYKVSEDASTLLFGGLQDMTFSDAEKWVKAKIKENKFEEPTVLYHKGDEFNGIVFVEFTTEKVAEEIAKQISIKLKDNAEAIWCKKDLPLEKRVPLSFLLGLRRQLIDWGFAKSKIRVKEEHNTLSVGGSQILTASIRSTGLAIDWKREDWKEWTEFVDSSEFKKLMAKAEETLQKAADNKGKGDGKGKKGH